SCEAVSSITLIIAGPAACQHADFQDPGAAQGGAAVRVFQCAEPYELQRSGEPPGVVDVRIDTEFGPIANLAVCGEIRVLIHEGIARSITIIGTNGPGTFMESLWDAPVRMLSDRRIALRRPMRMRERFRVKNAGPHARRLCAFRFSCWLWLRSRWRAPVRGHF